MSEQYWIGGFYIDISRNQITQNNQSQTLAPKALAVLTLLAENHGKVVSQDTLLTEVWKDTVVSPNTLQRSIAQLRKALGDDGKVQVYIKTHAKQGYSLECDVRWHDDGALTNPNVTDNTAAELLSDGEVNSNNETNPTNDSSTPPSPTKFTPTFSGFTLLFVIVTLIIVSIVGYQYSTQTNEPQIVIDKIRSLTATDDKEFDASYSPDGKYIVFHRYLDKQCVNKVWAKNIETQQETLLTENWGAYGRHSFSEDGKTLIFLATAPCNQPVNQTSCYDLVSLNFAKALESPQKPSTILQCKNSIVKKPIWLDDDNIAMLQKSAQRWKLINYSISENKSSDLYTLTEGNLFDYAYSIEEDLIAVIANHSDGQHYIDLLKPDGRILSSNPIVRPAEIPKFRPIYPSFDPLNKQLIFSTGRQLFTLSYDGKVNKISLPFTDRMARPELHPDGKRILLIKGPYDSDIVLLPLDQIAKVGIAETHQADPIDQSYQSFERSNLGEDYAMFQPKGDLIAFWSERSGEEQIWLSDGKTATQISHFPMDTYIRGMDWAADGNSLLVSASSILTQVNLDSTEHTFPMEYPVIRLFQWDSINNLTLLLTRINGVIKLVEYDLLNSTVKELTDKTVLAALRSEDGRLIYKDHMGQFWQRGPIEDTPIQALDNQGGRSKGFLIHNNVIFGFNDKNTLWSFDLNTNTLTELGQISENIDYLTDINHHQLLMTLQVSAKKEVAELTLK